MSKARDAGKSIGEALTKVNWYWSMDALVLLPALLFAEYVPDSNRMYSRGEVIRTGSNKWLLQGDGRIDPNNPPATNSLCKLFRDDGRYDPDGTPRNWWREEYCVRDFERYYEDPNQPKNTGWYRVIVDRVDDATPPPNEPQSWEKV